MMPVYLPTDEQLATMRERGELVCQCPDPIYEPVWWSYQCSRCLKKIAGT